MQTDSYDITNVRANGVNLLYTEDKVGLFHLFKSSIWIFVRSRSTENIVTNKSFVAWKLAQGPISVD